MSSSWSSRFESVRGEARRVRIESDKGQRAPAPRVIVVIRCLGGTHGALVQTVTARLAGDQKERTTQHSTSNNCSNDWSSGGHGVGSVDDLDIVRLSLSAVIKIWEEFRGPPSARLFDSGKGVFVRYRMYVCVVLAAVLGARLLCCGAQMGAGGTMLGAGRWVVGPVVNRTWKNNPESSGHCRPAALWNIEI